MIKHAPLINPFKIMVKFGEKGKEEKVWGKPPIPSKKHRGLARENQEQLVD